MPRPCPGCLLHDLSCLARWGGPRRCPCSHPTWCLIPWLHGRHRCRCTCRASMFRPSGYIIFFALLGLLGTTEISRHDGAPAPCSGRRLGATRTRALRKHSPWREPHTLNRQRVPSGSSTRRAPPPPPRSISVPDAGAKQPHAALGRPALLAAQLGGGGRRGRRRAAPGRPPQRQQRLSPVSAYRLPDTGPPLSSKRITFCDLPPAAGARACIVPCGGNPRDVLGLPPRHFVLAHHLPCSRRWTPPRHPVMRVAWNTFLAPLMPRRAARLPRVLQTLTELIEKQEIDVLALQELHGYMRGPIGTWLGAAWDGVPAWLERWLGPGAAHALQIVSELLAMAEGWLWPRAYHAPYRHAVVQHCVARGLAYATPIASPCAGPGGVPTEPGLGDHGVVILSRWPLTHIMSYYLPTDIIHRPGAVCATTRNEKTGEVLRVWSAHLLPQLPDAKATYRAARANRLAGARAAAARATCSSCGGWTRRGRGRRQRKRPLWPWALQHDGRHEAPCRRAWCCTSRTKHALHARSRSPRLPGPHLVWARGRGDDKPQPPPPPPYARRRTPAPCGRAQDPTVPRVGGAEYQLTARAASRSARAQAARAPAALATFRQCAVQ